MGILSTLFGWDPTSKGIQVPEEMQYWLDQDIGSEYQPPCSTCIALVYVAIEHIHKQVRKPVQHKDLGNKKE